MSDQEVLIAPQEGSQEDFLNHEADVVFYGGAAGSGKSHALVMDALKYVEDPNFYAIYFRQNNTQLEGSLWPLAKTMYRQYDENIHIREKGKLITFPSGAKITFGYMELQKHADSHQGIEYSAVYWDEFTHFSFYQFNYLRSRLRSKATAKSYMKASMNPDRDHFVFNWVEPYLRFEDKLDESGNAIEDMKKGTPDREICGRIRYFIMNGNDVVSSWDYDELKAQFPRKKPKTYTFIAGTIDDNPILDEIEPDYRETLESLVEVEKQRLRYGNWFARPEGSSYFDRNWCEVVPLAPASAVRVRSWDIASTIPNDINPNPDWTAGVKMSKDKDGFYYVEDVIRFRDRPAGVDAKILDTAVRLDGTDVKVTVPQDPGAAGKSMSQQQVRMLAERGFNARSKPTNKNKVTRFAPFSAAAEAGLVRIVRGSWNEVYFNELEAFIGDGLTKDDQADGTSDAFIDLAEKKHIPSFSLPTFEQKNPFAQRA